MNCPICNHWINKEITLVGQFNREDQIMWCQSCDMYYHHIIEGSHKITIGRLKQYRFPKYPIDNRLNTLLKNEIATIRSGKWEDSNDFFEEIQLGIYRIY